MPARPKRQPRSSDPVQKLVLASLAEDKAEDVAVIDIAGKSTVADSMVVCSGRSSRQVAAIADHLAERLKDNGFKGVRVEGKSQGDWVLVDAGDVIVHVFRPEVRELYQLERLWSFPEGPAEAKPARATRRKKAPAPADDEAGDTDT
ncbi:ribosome silencing factor [Vineibacter terrae]|uniref:Ribosomal silencing factor RsfS n=1 Tax=Vineibacter terrae TaxID=2586908 RepID=A0A5C8PSG5_9HYPH|nr:ribosome silencing factor [Vineibacter terrae]